MQISRPTNKLGVSSSVAAAAAAAAAAVATVMAAVLAPGRAHLQGQLPRQAAGPKQRRQVRPLGLHLQPALQHGPDAAQRFVPLDHALLRVGRRGRAEGGGAVGSGVGSSDGRGACT